MINNVKRLPDAYDKQTLSNISKLLQIAYELAAAQETDSNDIFDSHAIENAYGKTLDYYGKMYGVSRGNATDKQYITKILSQIARNSTGADANAIIKAIELTFQAKNVSLTENDMSVTVNGLTTDVLSKSGYTTTEEIETIIESLLPVGVGLNTVAYNGTLQIFENRVFGDPDYPTLYTAWYLGQTAYANGDEVGLKGSGSVPATFLDYAPEYQQSGTYDGGTMTLFSN